MFFGGYGGGCGYGYGGLPRLRRWQWFCFNYRAVYLINHYRLCLLGRIWRLLIISLPLSLT